MTHNAGHISHMNMNMATFSRTVERIKLVHWGTTVYNYVLIFYQDTTFQKKVFIKKKYASYCSVKGEQNKETKTEDLF